MVNDKPKDGQPTLNCYCSTLNSHFIGIITDKGRIIEYVKPSRLLYEVRLLWVIIPLLILGACCPFWAMRLDRNDLMYLEQDVHAAKISD